MEVRKVHESRGVLGGVMWRILVSLVPTATVSCGSFDCVGACQKSTRRVFGDRVDLSVACPTFLEEYSSCEECRDETGLNLTCEE